MNPLTAISPADLRTRQSEKWRRYDPDVVPLWVAEMDTPLAAPVQDALRAAIDRGDTGYAHPGRLAEVYAGFAHRRFGWWPDPTRMLLTGDVSQGVVEVLRRTTGPGDGVVLNTPAYPPFFDELPHAGRRVVESPLARADDGSYRLDLDRLAADFAAPTTTAYLLVNPHNPTGLVLSRDELSAVARLANDHGVRVLADEIHSPLTYPGATHVPFLSVPGSERAYAFVSASKAWNLAGLKAALIVGGPGAELDLPEHARFGAGILGVVASEAALRFGLPWLDALMAGLDANRRLLAELLRDHLPEVRYRMPDATYLAWLDCRPLGLGDDPAAAFLSQGRVALHSGTNFGPAGVGHARLNFATHPDLLTEAVRRMATVLSRR